MMVRFMSSFYFWLVGWLIGWLVWLVGNVHYSLTYTQSFFLLRICISFPDRHSFVSYRPLPPSLPPKLTFALFLDFGSELPGMFKVVAQLMCSHELLQTKEGTLASSLVDLEDKKYSSSWFVCHWSHWRSIHEEKHTSSLLQTK